MRLPEKLKRPKMAVRMPVQKIWPKQSPLGQSAWLLRPRLPCPERRLRPSALGRQCRQGSDAA